MRGKFYVCWWWCLWCACVYDGVRTDKAPRGGVSSSVIVDVSRRASPIHQGKFKLFGRVADEGDDFRSLSTPSAECV